MSDVPSRMLRETLRDSLAPPSPSDLSGCLDADVLAAWSDGTLGRREREVAESHASTCARCQAMLAAMAKTAAPVPERKWWQTSTVRWLVPIAVVPALAIAVWMNVPAERQAATAPPLSDFGAPAAPAAVAETRPAEVAVPAAKAKTPDRLELPAEAKRTEQRVARADQKTAPAATAAAPSAPEPRAQSSIQPEADQTFRTRVAAPDAAAAAPATTQPPAQPPVGLSSAAAPRALAETVTVQERVIVGDRQSPRPVEIPSPNRSVRWRIVASTAVERSTDGGATWQAQSTGAPVRLTAGAAPSQTICWIVGAGGTVLVTRDGATWERVAFPGAIDLTAILAVDGSNATATAADGRVFTTTDGGKTWRAP
jgi:Photosynthesis system II assembly factor YCF48